MGYKTAKKSNNAKQKSSTKAVPDNRSTLDNRITQNNNAVSDDNLVLEEKAASSAQILNTGKIELVWNQRFSLSVDNLALQMDQRYAVLGANGSGKSTLLRLLAEKLMQHQAFAQPGTVGYLPQKPYNFRRTVSENVRLGFSPLTGVSKEVQDEAIKNSLALLGLTHLAEADGHRLSGGEAQRMALARVLVTKRKILLLDEPTSAQDLNGMKLAEEAIKYYCQTYNCMLIMITHQIHMAERICDQLIFMDQGRINKQGSLSCLLEKPSSEKLKQFFDMI